MIGAHLRFCVTRWVCCAQSKSAHS
jgi:hypothetical protein